MPKKAEVDPTKNYITVTFTGISREEWGQSLAFVKGLPNRSFSSKDKSWKVGYTENTLQLIKNEGFTITGVDDTVFEKIKKEEALAEQGIQPWEEIQIPESEFTNLRNYQLDFLKFFEYRNGRGLCGDEMGTGKAQDVHTPTLTPSGWVSLGELKIGDMVYGSDGQPCKVTGVFPQGMKKNYRVQFSDQSETNCCDEHLWKCLSDSDSQIDIDWEVRSLRNIMKAPTNTYIPITQPINLPEKTYTATPYNTGASLAVNDARGVGLGQGIPQEYLQGSKSQRLGLLRGLMDRCGFRGDRCDVITITCCTLVHNIKSLVSSLGGVALLKRRSSTHTSLKYRLDILLSINPYRESFQAIKWRVPSKIRPIKYFESIECIGVVESVCISVDSPDHTYITEDYIVTHNTVQSLSYLKLHPEITPTLIVVPANVKLQWAREYPKWSSRKNIELLYGKTPYELSHDKDYIINWDILSNWKKELLKVPFKMIIGDEIQAIGNMKSLRTKAFRALGKESPGLIMMSGTPIKKRPKQFFSILNLIDPQTFGNEWRYLQRYCGPTHNGFGYQFNGASNLPELHKFLKPLMIRREKKDVLKELPAKIKTVVPLEITSDMREYKKLESQLFGNFSESALQQRDQLAELSMSAFAEKEIAVQKWISDILDSCDKIIIFAWHNAVVEAIQQNFNECAAIVYGKMTAAQKDSVVAQFKTDPNLKIIVGNIASLGTGVDGLQTVCSNVAFVEFPWSPAEAAQAEDRLHRMGQAHPVNVYYLPCPGTIDDMFIEMLDKESGTFEQLINGRDLDESQLLKALMVEYARTRT